jgi:LysR family cys regulon transcriptional activator
MKLQQLEYFIAVCDNGFNISDAATRLYTTQPAVSKHIAALEEELGVLLFIRRGKKIANLTAEGIQVQEYARRTLREVDKIRHIGDAYSNPESGSLSIATTHTQACYFLPKVINAFKNRYPYIELHIEQNSPQQNAKLVSDGLIDIAICTESLDEHDDLATIPCYQWNRHILVPKGHPLCQEHPIGLEAIAEFPLVSYTRGYTGRPKLDQAFHQKGLHPNIVIAASDADVIKTYVRLGMGVGIIAQMAYEPLLDQDLVAIDASHLFPFAITRVAYRKDKSIKRHVYDFIRLLSPKLKIDLIDDTIHYQQQDGKVPWFNI